MDEPLFHIGTHVPRPTVRQPRQRIILSIPQATPIKSLISGKTEFKDIFPSLLSNVKNIPPSMLVFLSLSNSSLVSRNKYLENCIYRLKRISKFTSNDNLPFCEIITELSLWIIKERFVCSAMRKFLYIWLHKKYGSRMLNENDPWTLCPPRNCITIFDAKSRGNYQFDANSLRHHIESGLGYSEWLFSAPYAPKNPLVNIAFHEGQRIAILNSLRRYGYGSWMIEAYRACNWNLKTFLTDNLIQLNLYAVNQLIKHPNEDLYELLEDFIDEQYKENDIKKKKNLIYIKWGVRNMFTNIYIQKWVSLFHEYYKLKFRYSGVLNLSIMNKIYVGSMQLFHDYTAISLLGNKRGLQFSNEFRHLLSYPTGPIPVNPALYYTTDMLDFMEIQNILNDMVGTIVEESFTVAEQTPSSS